MLTALSWFGLKQRAFRPSDMDKALTFLGANSRESETIRNTVVQLREEVADVCKRTGSDR
jgi:hypothetical protein